MSFQERYNWNRAMLEEIGKKRVFSIFWKLYVIPGVTIVSRACQFFFLEILKSLCKELRSHNFYTSGKSQTIVINLTVKWHSFAFNPKISECLTFFTSSWPAVPTILSFRIGFNTFLKSAVDIDFATAARLASVIWPGSWFLWQN